MIDRFKTLLKQLNLTPSEFADRIGVQRSSMSHILSGRNKPSIDFLVKILNVFPDTDANWLITGNIREDNTSMKAGALSFHEEVSIIEGEKSGEEKIKPPVPEKAGPVDQIIIVFKNNTFRIIKPE